MGLDGFWQHLVISLFKFVGVGWWGSVDQAAAGRAAAVYPLSSPRGADHTQEFKCAADDQDPGRPPIQRESEPRRAVRLTIQSTVLNSACVAPAE